VLGYDHLESPERIGIVLSGGPGWRVSITKKGWDAGELVKTFLRITSGVGIAAFLFAGYIFIRAIPDVGRYVRISRM
jgi:hypothetical protein